MLRLSVSLFTLMAIPVFAEVDADLWARATPPGGSSGAIYGIFVNQAPEAVTLESISFAGTRHVMVHETRYVNGIAKMRHADLLVPGSGKATLAPDGLHIMLMGLDTPLIAGCAYPVVLRWSDGSQIEYPVTTGSIGQLNPPEVRAKKCHN